MFWRALIFLLVVLNLGVTLWWLARSEAHDADAGVDLPAGIARLQLADEDAADRSRAQASRPAPPTAGDAPADGAPAAAAPEAPSLPAASAPPARCYALGPFADAAAASAARAVLPAEVLGVRSREATAASAPWRVVMPALPDRAAANAMAQRLRDAGFADLFVVGEGAEANSIALGRFGGAGAAREHGNALQRAGFDVRVEPVPGSTRHWLDVAVGEDITTDALRRATEAARVEPGECPPLAATAR
jgi:hypothetical protein